jgi:hypothetical protein
MGTGLISLAVLNMKYMQTAKRRQEEKSVAKLDALSFGFKQLKLATSGSRSLYTTVEITRDTVQQC